MELFNIELLLCYELNAIGLFVLGITLMQIADQQLKHQNQFQIEEEELLRNS